MNSDSVIRYCNICQKRPAQQTINFVVPLIETCLFGKTLTAFQHQIQPKIIVCSVCTKLFENSQYQKTYMEKTFGKIDLELAKASLFNGLLRENKLDEYSIRCRALEERYAVNGSIFG